MPVQVPNNLLNCSSRQLIDEGMRSGYPGGLLEVLNPGLGAQPLYALPTLSPNCYHLHRIKLAGGGGGEHLSYCPRTFDDRSVTSRTCFCSPSILNSYSRCFASASCLSCCCARLSFCTHGTHRTQRDQPNHFAKPPVVAMPRRRTVRPQGGEGRGGRTACVFILVACFCCSFSSQTCRRRFSYSSFWKPAEG